MKTIYLFICFILFSVISFSQEAETFVVIDSVKGHAYEIEKNTKVTVVTKGVLYQGALNELNKDELVVVNMSIPWAEVESINFKDKEMLGLWMKISGIALLTTTVISILPFIDEPDGFAGMVIVLFTIPALVAISLFFLIGYLKYKKGRTIKYKK